jgi:hypothetical protein
VTRDRGLLSVTQHDRNASRLAYGVNYCRSILLADRHCWSLDWFARFENAEVARWLAFPVSRLQVEDRAAHRDAESAGEVVLVSFAPLS